MRSVVLIRGVLRGMGREAPCEMLAIQETQPETAQAVYFRCSVIDAPMELPDGDYTLAFNGHAVAARKEGGLWVPGGATSPAADEERHADSGTSFRIEDTVEILPIRRNRVA
jgi:hypothetical protein